MQTADCIGFACFAIAAFGALYAIVAAAWFPRFGTVAARGLNAQRAVTILKPLRGAEPALHENLRTFCEQRYDAPIQLLFGIEDEADPAADVVRRLKSEYPARDIELVVTAPARAANPKIGTLCTLQPRIRHPIVVLADSDIGVPADYLSRVTAALDAPGVGLVTCLYRGESRGGLYGTLAAMAIDYHFLPSVVVGLRLRLARPCFGSTIALSRQTLAAIGGFDAFAEHLADDHAIGEAVRAAGMHVAIPDFVVAHTCSEATLGALARHELRWGRTIRAVSPLGYAASVVTQPLPFALIGYALTSANAVGLAVIAATIVCRLVLELRVDHTLRSPTKRWWLGPIRDLLSFAIYAASFFVHTVTWRGRRYRVRADATLAAIGD